MPDCLSLMIAEEQEAPLSVSNPHTEQNIIIFIVTNTRAYLCVSESVLELFLEVCEQQIFSLCQFFSAKEIQMEN